MLFILFDVVLHNQALKTVFEVLKKQFTALFVVMGFTVLIIYMFAVVDFIMFRSSFVIGGTYIYKDACC